LAAKPDCVVATPDELIGFRIDKPPRDLIIDPVSARLIYTHHNHGSRTRAIEFRAPVDDVASASASGDEQNQRNKD
jgi:hypothetical protein